MPLTKDRRIYANQNKSIMKKWDYEKNNAEGIYPENFSENSHLPANFVCPDCGHKWKGSIRDAGRYNGCKKCMNKARSISNRKTRLKKGKSLFETNPELAKEWDYNENDKIGLYPEEVMAGTQKKAYWICPLKHSYVAYISNRANKHTGCTFCSGQEVLEGFNDLATTRPDLLKEWDYEKNSKINLFPNSVMRGTHESAHWICPVGHEYKKEIKLRTSGQGCTECAKESQTSFPEQAIYYYMKKIFNNNVINRYGKPEIDIFIPSLKLGIEYDGFYAHKNKEVQERRKDLALKKQGIDLIRIKEVKQKKQNTNNIIYCEISGNYNYLEDVLYKLIAILNKRYNIITKVEINIDKDRLEIEEQYINSLKENSILNKKPELEKEWDYDKNGKIKPGFISYGSSKKYWWRCNGHSYLSPPKRRMKGMGCSYCALKEFKSGINDIKTIYPDVIKDWDYELNKNLPEESITVLSHHFYWKCSKGHSYYGTLRAKLNGKICTVCSGKELVVGVNDLVSQKPELAEEWDYEKNEYPPEHYTATSNKPVFWICKKCGYKWEYIINNRCHCPNCKKEEKSINVYAIQTGKKISTFEGIRNLCEFLNIDYKKQHGNVSLVCKRKQKTLMNKYILRYNSDDEFKNISNNERKGYIDNFLNKR